MVRRCINNLMEIVSVGGTADYRHYLGEMAILTNAGNLSDPYPELRFLLRDRLGSVVTVLDGHHRAAAARQVGIRQVPIRTHEVTPKQADQLMRQAAEALNAR